MNTRYKILCMVDLMHEYYKNLQCRDFTLLPSAETAERLKNGQMMCKMIGNKLVVLVKVQTDGPDTDTPFVPIDADTKLLFYLDLDQPVFTTITNLDADRLRVKQRYYFSNLTGNEAADTLYLTGRIDDYGSLGSYTPSQMVQNGGLVYECVRPTSGSSTNDPDFWYKRGPAQYATSADMLPFITHMSRFKTTSKATGFTVKVFGLNKTTNTYNTEIPVTKNAYTSDQPTDEVLVDLSELASGRYKILINSDVFEVFLDDTAVYRNFFGVIELFGHLPASSNFAWLDGDGKIKDRIVDGNFQWLRYQVRFANRLAFWKYVTPNKGVKAITDKTDTYKFLPSPPLSAEPDYFLSNHPIPIQETPALYDIELNGSHGSEGPLAPNPDPNVTGMLTRTEPDKNYFCTIYLNY